MPWGEAWRLFETIAVDPSSRICAALNGWPYPVDRAAVVLMDLYDLQHKKAAGKKAPQPYPRPWDERRKRYGKTTLPPGQVKELLAEMAGR